MTFHVGQLVVKARGGSEVMPIKTVARIKKIVDYSGPTYQGDLYFGQVLTFFGWPESGHGWRGFAASTFEPLVDADTDDAALIARIRACKPARQEAG